MLKLNDLDNLTKIYITEDKKLLINKTKENKLKFMSITEKFIEKSQKLEIKMPENYDIENPEKLVAQLEADGLKETMAKSKNAIEIQSEYNKELIYLLDGDYTAFNEYFERNLKDKVNDKEQIINVVSEEITKQMNDWISATPSSKR